MEAFRAVFFFRLIVDDLIRFCDSTIRSLFVCSEIGPVFQTRNRLQTNRCSRKMRRKKQGANCTFSRVLSKYDAAMLDSQPNPASNQYEKNRLRTKLNPNKSNAISKKTYLLAMVFGIELRLVAWRFWVASGFKVFCVWVLRDCCSQVVSKPLVSGCFGILGRKWFQSFGCLVVSGFLVASSFCVFGCFGVLVASGFGI